MSFGFGFGFPKRLTSGGGLSPRLYLDFVGTGSLPSTVTFSRGTNATLTDSNGRVAWAPHNLLTNSEDFEAAAWAPANATITANSAVAPNGTTTADTLTTSGAALLQRVLQNASQTGQVTFSVYAKAGTAQFLQILNGSDANCFANFNLSTGVVGTAGTGASSTISDAGSGWYRCTITYTLATSSNWQIYIAPSASATYGQAFGATVANLFLWGAQLNVANAPVNLLTWSEQINGGVGTWFNNNSPTVTTNNPDPNGTNTASKIVVNGTTVNQGVYVNATAIPAGQSGLFSVWLRGELGGEIVQIGDAGSRQNVTLTTSWQRFSNPSHVLTSTFHVIYAKDNTAMTFYAWGAQLNTGSVALPYVATTSSIYLPPAYNSTTPKNLLGFTQEPENAAWTKSNSYVQQNLLTWSQDFDNAAWQPNTSTVTANTTVAPNGTTTADTLVPNNGVVINIAFAGIFTAGASSYLTRAAATTLQNVPYTASFYVKAGATLTHIQFRNGSNADLTGTSYNIIVRLADGFVVSADGTATSQSVGNGWYRITLTFTPVAGSYYSGFWFWNDTSITCNGSQNVLVWGAQLVQGSTAGDYTQTTSAAAPTRYLNWDGTLTGRKLVEDATATITHQAYQNYAAPATGLPLTFAVYAKAAERTKMTLYSMGNEYTYDLVAGTTSGTGTAIQSVGNGWYRCSITLPSPDTANRSYIVRLNNGSTTTYTGDGTSGIYVSDFQLSNSASVDPYVYNPQAAAASAAYYGPRFDYNPTTLAANGLLIEEQRTNLLTYSEQFDNAAWTLNNPGTRTANTDVAPDGTMTADTVTDNITTNFTSVRQTVTVANNNQQYTCSAYFKKTTSASSFPGFSLSLTGGTLKYASGALNTTTGVATARTGEVPDFITVTDAGTYWRVQWGITNNTSGNTSLIVDLIPAVNTDASATWAATTTGSAVMWGAQLEQGSFATSYIPTVASQVTRNADSASMLGDNFYTWYNPNQGTMLGEGDAFALTAATSLNTFMSLNDGTANNYQNIYTFGSNGYGATVTGGVVQANPGVTTVTLAANQVYKSVYAYQVNNFGYTVNGATVVTDTLGSVPPASQANLGSRLTASSMPLNGHIRRIGYYNTRLPDSTLQALTV